MGTFENLGDWEKFKYEGAYKISCGFEKIEGQGFQGACYRGVFLSSVPMSTDLLTSSDKREIWTCARSKLRFRAGPG